MKKGKSGGKLGGVVKPRGVVPRGATTNGPMKDSGGEKGRAKDPNCDKYRSKKSNP